MMDSKSPPKLPSWQSVRVLDCARLSYAPTYCICGYSVVSSSLSLSSLRASCLISPCCQPSMALPPPVRLWRVLFAAANEPCECQSERSAALNTNTLRSTTFLRLPPPPREVPAPFFFFLLLNVGLFSSTVSCVRGIQPSRFPTHHTPPPP
ncbi:hypothetical protein GGS23DRAFT_559141, partial [Durotheca rogersii]|uniref:uncharacterized protein n=1 Tax=Durotheca rogersii TaxID=419775 RepID=UPI00221F5F3B